MGSLRFNLPVAPGIAIGLSRRGASVNLAGGLVEYRFWDDSPTATTAGRRRNSARKRHESLTGFATHSPVVSICCGIVLLAPCIALLVAAPPLGVGAIAVPLYMIGVSWWTLGQTETKDRRLIEKIRKHPARAEELLTTALQRRPQDPTLIACLGDLRRDQKRWTEARDLYTTVLAFNPNEVRVRADLGGALVQLADWTGAIEALEAVRQSPTLTEESRASVVAHLALAYIGHGDLLQAVELVAAQPLERRTLNSGLEQCLFVRAIARYLLGERSRAVRDLARLHALNPNFVQAQQAKTEMENGTFELT